MTGLIWGAVAGIGLKVLDSFAGLCSANPTIGMLFLLAAGVCAIPRMGWTLMLGITLLFNFFAKVNGLPNVNLFVMVLGALFAGALLGCFPGMAVGGVVGLLRRKGLPQAPDARPEGGVFLKLVVLPTILGAGIWAAYLLWLIPLVGGAFR